MKPSVFTLCVVFACGGLTTRADVWQPAAGRTQMPIWPGAAPDATAVPGAENCTTTTELIAGRPCLVVNNVSRPTMTVYSPEGANTGAAVVVLPGGGYQCLTIDLEGTEVCEWLVSRGITAMLLKYRVPTPRTGPYHESTQALQDAQRTLSLVRSHAAEWHIDPHKIGVIGFSAGGHMVAATSTRFDKRSYPPVDAADKESCRPDFAIAVYPGHLWYPDKEFVLNPNVRVTHNTPPTFILQAENDPVDNVNNSLVYYIALKNAGVPVEMHLYAEGKHAFGLRPMELPITKWPDLVETWLKTIGMTSSQRNSPAVSTARIQPEPAKPQRLHMVRDGETLSEISRRYYGSADLWRKIFDANRETLRDANTVKAGTQLVIPD
ncbi:MAG: alpha/beta hydrolase fold domain-containing protein [Phycisphaerales bacterium]